MPPHSAGEPALAHDRDRGGHPRCPAAGSDNSSDNEFPGGLGRRGDPARTNSDGPDRNDPLIALTQTQIEVAQKSTWVRNAPR